MHFPVMIAVFYKVNYCTDNEIANVNVMLQIKCYGNNNNYKDIHFAVAIVPITLNSWAPGRLQENLRKNIFKLILVTDGYGISGEITLRWTSLDLSDDKSTLVQVMSWCRQATSHYLNQCRPKSLPPYGVTRPQWVVRSMIKRYTQ